MQKKSPKKYESVLGIVRSQNKPTKSRRLPPPDYSVEVVFWDGAEWSTARGCDRVEVVDWFPIDTVIYQRITDFITNGGSDGK